MLRRSARPLLIPPTSHWRCWAIIGSGSRSIRTQPERKARSSRYRSGGQQDESVSLLKETTERTGTGTTVLSARTAQGDVFNNHSPPIDPINESLFTNDVSLLHPIVTTSKYSEGEIDASTSRVPQRPFRRVTIHRGRVNARSTFRGQPDTFNSAYSFFSALNALLEDQTSSDKLVQFLRSSQFLQHNVTPSMLGDDEHELLQKTIEQVANHEFHRWDVCAPERIQAWHGATLWLIQSYRRRSIIQSAHWSSALTQSASALSSNYFVALDAALKAPTVRQTLSQFDYKGLYHFGLRLDSVITLWHEFCTDDTERADGGDDGQSPQPRPNLPWAKVRQLHPHAHLDERSFGMMLNSLAGNWTRHLDESSQRDIAVAAVLVCLIVVDALKLSTVASRKFSDKKWENEVLHGPPEPWQDHVDLLKRLVQVLGSGREDYFFVKWVCTALATAPPNFTLLKLNLAKLGVPSGIGLGMENRLLSLRGFATSSLEFHHLEVQHEPLKALRIRGRFDHLVTQIIQRLPTASVEDYQDWCFPMREIMFGRYTLGTFFQDMNIGSRNWEGHEEDKERLSRREGELERAWRVRTSVRFRHLFTSNNAAVFISVLHELRRFSPSPGHMSLVWYYYLIRLLWRTNPAAAVDVFIVLASDRTRHDGKVWTLSDKQIQRIARHSLRLAVPSHPAQVQRIWQELNKCGIKQDATMRLLLFEWAVRFKHRAIKWQLLGYYRGRSTTDMPLRPISRQMLKRELESFADENRGVGIFLTGLIADAVHVRSRLVSVKKCREFLRSKLSKVEQDTLMLEQVTLVCLELKELLSLPAHDQATQKLLPSLQRTYNRVRQGFPKGVLPDCMTEFMNEADKTINAPMIGQETQNLMKQTKGSEVSMEERWEAMEKLSASSRAVAIEIECLMPRNAPVSIRRYRRLKHDCHPGPTSVTHQP